MKSHRVNSNLGFRSGEILKKWSTGRMHIVTRYIENKDGSITSTVYPLSKYWLIRKIQVIYFKLKIKIHKKNWQGIVNKIKQL